MMYCIAGEGSPLKLDARCEAAAIEARELILDIHILLGLMLEAYRTLILSVMPCFQVDGNLLSGALDLKQLSS